MNVASHAEGSIEHRSRRKEPTPRELIGETFREHRLKEKLTQQEVASRSGVRLSQISNLERKVSGSLDVTFDDLKKIAEALKRNLHIEPVPVHAHGNTPLRAFIHDAIHRKISFSVELSPL